MQTEALLANIFSYLEFTALGPAAQTCRQWHRASNVPGATAVLELGMGDNLDVLTALTSGSQPPHRFARRLSRLDRLEISCFDKCGREDQMEQAMVDIVRYNAHPHSKLLSVDFGNFG